MRAGQSSETAPPDTRDCAQRIVHPRPVRSLAVRDPLAPLLEALTGMNSAGAGNAETADYEIAALCQPVRIAKSSLPPHWPSCDVRHPRVRVAAATCQQLVVADLIARVVAGETVAPAPYGRLSGTTDVTRKPRLRHRSHRDTRVARGRRGPPQELGAASPPPPVARLLGSSTRSRSSIYRRGRSRLCATAGEMAR